MPLHKGSQKEVVLRTIMERNNTLDPQRFMPMMRRLFPGRSASTHNTVLRRLIEDGLLVRRYTVTEKGQQALAEAIDTQAWPPRNKNKRDKNG